MSAPWLLWCLLVVVALPLIVLAFGTYRTVRGDGYVGDAAPPGADTRIAAVALLRAPEQRLVAPLLGLVAVAWLLHQRSPVTPPRAARTAAAALGGVLALQAAGQLAALGYLLAVTAPTGTASATSPLLHDVLACTTEESQLRLQLSPSASVVSQDTCSGRRPCGSDHSVGEPPRTPRSVTRPVASERVSDVVRTLPITGVERLSRTSAA